VGGAGCSGPARREEPSPAACPRHVGEHGFDRRIAVGRLTRHLGRQGSGHASAPRATYQPHKLCQLLSDETVAAILATHQAGATTRDLGGRFGLAHSSINKLLRQQGVIARRRSPSPDEVQRAVELYEEGQTTRVIAEHLGFGANTIKRSLERAGVTLRPTFGG
jgi:hypothetical protein